MSLKICRSVLISYFIIHSQLKLYRIQNIKIEWDKKYSFYCSKVPPKLKNVKVKKFLEIFVSTDILVISYKNKRVDILYGCCCVFRLDPIVSKVPVACMVGMSIKIPSIVGNRLITSMHWL